MNEQLQQKLLEYLNNGEAFVRGQAPEFVNQAMAYYSWSIHFELVVWLVLSIVIFSIAVASFWTAVTDDDDVYWFVGFGAAFFTVLLITMTCSTLEDLKKLELAPKLYLLNKITHAGCGK